MATFKVGDRVKRAREIVGHAFCAAETPLPIGATGTVTEVGDWIWVNPDGNESRNWGCAPESLEPLTPPAADAWAADAVRKVTKPQHVEPVAPMPEPIFTIRAP